MDFGDALGKMRDGCPVTRQAPEWAGLSVTLVPATGSEAARFAITCADGRPAVAFPKSDVDLLARDWVLAGHRPRCEAPRDEAVELLKRVLFLRQNGERPPGAPADDPEAETWQELDRAIEAYLQGIASR